MPCVIRMDGIKEYQCRIFPMLHYKVKGFFVIRKIGVIFQVTDFVKIGLVVWIK